MFTELHVAFRLIAHLFTCNCLALTCSASFFCGSLGAFARCRLQHVFTPVHLVYRFAKTTTRRLTILIYELRREKCR
jgi:hypothetical protein